MIYGNHRDSWVHGAIDPSSGTSVMLELTRVLGAKVKQGEGILHRKQDLFLFPAVESDLCCGVRQENGGLAGQSSLEAGGLRSSV